MQPFSRIVHLGACTSLVALIILCVAWELVLAPLRPEGSWLVLKVIPLLLPLRAVFKRQLYTMQWASMLILLYVAEGTVRGMSDASEMSRLLGWTEAGLATAFFVLSIMYLHPFKKAAKKLTKQTIQKASQMAQQDD